VPVKKKKKKKKKKNLLYTVYILLYLLINIDDNTDVTQREGIHQLVQQFLI
jgi:hypothetical protein